MNRDILVLHQAPKAEEFVALREAVGWSSPSISRVRDSIRNSLFHVTIRSGTQLIAMARVVGDGVMYFYIQDVVVEPSYMSQGFGSTLMLEIERYLNQHAPKGATIGLLSVSGKERFYERYGYISRPVNQLGHGMCKFT